MSFRCAPIRPKLPSLKKLPVGKWLMKDETRQWLKYAAENLGAASAVLDAGYLNACLQNCQQVVEKAMKSLLIEFALEFRKTHHIRELKGLLDNAHISVDISRSKPLKAPAI